MPDPDPVSPIHVRAVDPANGKPFLNAYMGDHGADPSKKLIRNAQKVALATTDLIAPGFIRGLTSDVTKPSGWID